MDIDNAGHSTRSFGTGLKLRFDEAAVQSGEGDRRVPAEHAGSVESGADSAVARRDAIARANPIVDTASKAGAHYGAVATFMKSIVGMRAIHAVNR